MSDRDCPRDSRIAPTRRTYVRSVGAVTGFGVLGTGSAVASPDEKQTPEHYAKKGAQGNSNESDVYLTHVSELDPVKRQLSAYERTRDLRHLLTFHLQQVLGSRSEDALDVTVSTCGERNTVTTTKYGREIHGWRPTTEEVKHLAEFGSVTFVPQVASTKVGLRNVSVSDLARIAALNFVLEIGYDPELQLQNGGTSSSGVETSSTTPTADDLKTTSHNAFNSVTYDLTYLTQVGIVGTGYPSTTDWSKLWADPLIDRDKANSFISGTTWDTGHEHGTNVADTVAYMVQEGDPHSDLIVPLRVWQDSKPYVPASALRNAIEYALTNDVEVLNISVETKDNSGYCTSTACEELDSYIDAGYVVACAAGHDSKETEVCYPATSHFTVGVGGYSGSCSGGYHQKSDSNYGTILYYNSAQNSSFCSWCHNEAGDQKFQPNVYGCGRFDTDDNVELSGNSYAAPAVAAAGAIHHSIHGATNYSDKLSDYNGMDKHIVCESDASQKGDILHVPDVT